MIGFADIRQNVLDKGIDHKDTIYSCDDDNGMFRQGGKHNQDNQTDE